MSEFKFISKNDLERIAKGRSSDHVIIFLSGPTSKKTPLSILKNHDVIAVNGSAQYLLDNDISPFIYVLTDVRFLHQRKADFYTFSKNSHFTIVNTEVYEGASLEDKEFIKSHCLILRSYYRREKGGVFKKIGLTIRSIMDKNLLIRVPWSSKGRLVGFSLDVSKGYCSCHTVAFAVIQIAYSLKYNKIICSGLDLVGDCPRFYDENNNPMPSELSGDLLKILPFFEFMQERVSNIHIYNLSDNTAINYNIVPFISLNEIDYH